MASSPQLLAIPASISQPLSVRWKRRLAEQRSLLQHRYLEMHSAAELLRGHRLLIDNQLRTVWQHLAMPQAVALVAAGGYGRSQLFPHSDIDLLILLPRAADSSLTQKLEQFIGLLW